MIKRKRTLKELVLASCGHDNFVTFLAEDDNWMFVDERCFIFFNPIQNPIRRKQEHKRINIARGTTTKVNWYCPLLRLVIQQVINITLPVMVCKDNEAKVTPARTAPPLPPTVHSRENSMDEFK